MFSKVCVLLLAIGLSQAAPRNQLPDIGLMKFMIQSRDISQDNPTRSFECFQYYLPKLNECAENYEEEYKQCSALAIAARNKIDDNTQDNRTAIDATATSSCKALETCSKITEAVEYFECYTQAVS